ncbi:MAG: TonB-dependent receptor plug domain-containing protein, partial [Gammaproteobacteria bacterium]|nr:TonB-dependent receptor plug domain-containing protein [Gammaproteobacteria bacterium]
MNFNNFKIVHGLILSLCILMTSISHAQFDESLLFADIPSVFTASKYEQKVTDAPARISVVTADEIRRYGYRTLVEVLNSLPGIQYSYDRNYTYLGVRGFNIPGDYNTRVLVMVDGHRINENIYDGVLIDSGNMVNLDLIKRIEVVRGPASSLYGSSAFFGVINIITKDGRDFNATELSADIGNHDANQGRVSYGKQYDNGLELMVSASAFNSKGEDLYFAEFDDPLTNNGIAENADDKGQRNLFLKLSYADVTVSAGYTELEKGIPTAAYDTLFNDNRTRTWEGQYYLHLNYSTLLESGTELTARMYYNNYWYDG